jgi:hypothetical protein
VQPIPVTQDELGAQSTPQEFSEIVYSINPDLVSPSETSGTNTGGGGGGGGGNPTGLALIAPLTALLVATEEDNFLPPTAASPAFPFLGLGGGAPPAPSPE